MLRHSFITLDLSVLMLFCLFLSTDRLDAQTVKPAKNNRVAYFQFEGNVNDLYPNHLQADARNVEFAKGFKGQGVLLNGNGNIRIPHSKLVDFDSAMTFGAWVWATQRYVEGCRIFELDNEIITLSLNHMGSLDFAFKSQNGGTQMLRSNGDNAVLYMDRWMRISAVLGNGLMLLFIDGKEVGRKSIPPNLRQIAETSGDFFIGNNRKGNRGYYGYLDEVTISKDVCPSVPPLIVEVMPYPAEGFLEVSANLIGSGVTDAGALCTVGIKIAGSDKFIQSIMLGSFDHSMAKGKLDLNILAPGEYIIEATVADGKSNKSFTASEPFAKPGQPVWANTSESIKETVPVSFTPVESKGDTLGCWRRKYIYSPASVFPSDIVSLNSRMLTAPIRLAGKINGSPVVWGSCVNNVTAISPAKAEVLSKTESGGLTLKITSTFEFDGMLRTDLSLTSSRPLTIDTLYLDVPIPRSIAKYYIYYPEKWAIGVPNAGSIPDSGWQSVFKPYLWVGNDDAGICWFAESTKGWSLKSGEPVLRLITRSNEVILRVMLVNKPLALERSLSITFGLQASPVKPLPEGRRIWRYGFDVPGDNVAVFWANPKYSRWYTFPQPINPDSFRMKIDDMHRRGKKVTFYSSLYYLSSIAPEWKYYKGDWWSYNVVFGQSDIVPFGHLSMPVCPAQKNYQDFILYQYKKFFEKYDTDGMYFDNGPLNTCQNPLHPECSYINSDGKTEYIYPWFAVREIKKKIYTMLKQKKPNGIIVFHLSMSPLLPLASFCDAYVDGEQFIFEGFTGDYLGTTSLDKVRAELTGRQFGLVSFFLPEITGVYANQEEPTDNLMAMVLLHDMNLWMHFCNKDVVNRTWAAVDKFGISNAEFYPYWNLTPCAETSDSDIKVSAYYRTGREALLVVVNVSDNVKTISLKLNPGLFGIKADTPLKAKDGFSGEPLSLQGNTFSLEVKGKNYRLCHIYLGN